MPVRVPDVPIGQPPGADNGYSISNIRAATEVCPVCHHEDPAPRRRLLGRDLRILLDDHVRSLVSGDYDDDDGLLWLHALGRTLVRHQGDHPWGVSVALACTCSRCGHHYAPAAHSRWVAAVEALASGGFAEPSRAGAGRTGAPGGDRAADPARVSGAADPRLAPPLDGPPAPNALTGDTLIELLGRIEDLDERVHGAEQTTAATVQALADERAARRDALDRESRKQAEITTGTTGILLQHAQQLGDLRAELGELNDRVLLESTRVDLFVGLVETAEQLRADLASLQGYVRALEQRADAADVTRNELRDLEAHVCGPEGLTARVEDDHRDLMTLEGRADALERKIDGLVALHALRLRLQVLARRGPQ